MAQVGCSAPTVIAALRELDARGEIERTKSRSVELRRLPRQTLDELVLRADRLRRTRWFVDRSGRANPEALLRRLTRAKLDGFAFGGVTAARHYDPSLDVLGLPRIDVSLHTARHSKFDAGLLTRIDPALAEVPSSKSEPILVVHSVTRAESLFEVAHGFPYADPAEVLVDLLELHLGAQASDFVKSLRSPRLAEDLPPRVG